MSKLRRFFIAIWLLLLPLFGMAQQKTVTTVLNGKEYTYNIEVYDPPKAITSIDKISQNKPEETLQSAFKLMKAGEVKQWKDLWENYDANDPFNTPDSNYINAWNKVLSVSHFIYFRVDYKDQVIFMTGPEDKTDRFKTMKWALKKVGKKWFFNRDLLKDDLMFFINNPDFDPASGVLSPQWSGIYHLDDDGSSIDDASKYQNNGVNHGAKKTRGVSGGTGLQFMQGDYIEIPTTLSLAFMKNQFTVEMNLYIESIPENEMTDNLKGSYQSIFFSKNQPNDYEFISFSAIKVDDESAKIQISIGTGVNNLTISSKPVKIKNWMKIESTYNGEVLTLSIDGKKEAEGRKKVQIAGLGENFFIGRQSGDPSLPFVGKMDELKISYETIDKKGN